MDTTAPRLTRFALPSTIDLGRGQTDLLLRVEARDEAGGSGMSVARIWLQQSPISPLGPLQMVTLGLPGSADSFSDATPLSASTLVPLSAATPDGVYRIYDIELVDLAGNVRHHYENDLLALGQPTAVTVKGSVADTSAPMLTGLQLPGTVSLGGGAAAVVFSASARDSGGSGLASVDLYFDRNLQVDGTTGARVSIGGLLAGGSDTFWDGTPGTAAYSGALSSATGAGVYKLLAAVVTDQSGNRTDYSAAQLTALGFDTSFTVAAGVQHGATARVDAAYVGGNVVLSVSSDDWTAGANGISFELYYDPGVALFAGATLVGGSVQGLSIIDNGSGLLSISGTAANGVASGAFLKLTMAPQPGSGDLPYAVGAFSVNGQAQDLGDAAQTAFYFGAAGLAQTPQAEVRVAMGGHQIAFDIDGNAGQAYRLYQAAFDRTPDLSGLGYWIGKLDQGTHLGQVADAFLASQEYMRLYGEHPTSAEFVTELYQNVLHREPEPAGYDYWLRAVEAGADRGQVLVDFSESAENVAQVIGAIQNGIAYIPY